MGLAVEAPLIQNLLFFPKVKCEKTTQMKMYFFSCIATYFKVYKRTQER